jgi:DNA-binding MarR family transcriptional regulator
MLTLMTEPRWLDIKESAAWRGYLAMNAQLMSRLARQLQTESKVSEADFAVLVVLTDHADGRVRVFELGRSLAWEKSRLSHHLARMQKRGLVARSECPSDARGAFIEITTAGRAAIERAAPRHVEQVRDLFFDQLTPAQVDTLRDIAEQVLARMRESSPPCESE